MVEIKYQGHKRRSRVAKDFWLRVVTDYNSGIAPEKIALRYTNPKTKKHYTREHIYYILKKMSTTPIGSL